MMPHLHRNSEYRRISLFALSVLLTSIALSLVMLMSSIGSVEAATPDGAIQVCVYGEACRWESDLQAAFSYISKPTRSGQVATITISAGVYTNTNSGLTVLQKSWRDSACVNTSYATNFMIENRTAATFIRGSNAAQPEKVVIWGGGPSANHVLSVRGIKASGGGTVHISNLSLVSNGYAQPKVGGNGIGDASLNVQNSTVYVTNTIITANKVVATNRNYPVPADMEIDQEGVFVYGPDAYLEIADSLIGGNYHTGIMLYNGGRAKITGSYIRGNGWDQTTGHPFAGKGHGVTTFYHVAQSCLGGNFEPKIHNSIIANNSGIGVYIRGNFSNRSFGIVNNTMYKNSAGGLIVGPSNNPFEQTNVMTLSSSSVAWLVNNLVVLNASGVVSSSKVVLNSASRIDIGYSNSVGNTAGNYDPISLKDKNNNKQLNPQFLCLGGSYGVCNGSGDYPVDFQLTSQSPSELWSGGWDGRQISSYGGPSPFKVSTLALWDRIPSVLSQLPPK